MNTKYNAITTSKTSLLMGIVTVICVNSLLGCEHQPKSPFEQQAEAESSNSIRIDETSDADQRADIAPKIIPESMANASINIARQQAIARQSDCDPKQNTCQYLELNTLAFTPEQPWLSSIMWQTIARTLSPVAPLTSQDQTAKNTVLKLFKQIEYNHKIVRSLPLYLRIDTEIVLNPVINSSVVNNNVTLEPLSTNISTGYLIIRSSQQRSTTQPQLNYVMLDIQKKLQLRVEDILLPQVTLDNLLQALQAPKRKWLTTQGVEQQYLKDWPLALSEQWYLDQQGLHMIYKSEDLSNTKAGTVDLLVPNTVLQGLIKPEYIVKPAA